MVKTPSLKVKKKHEKLIFNGEHPIFKGEKTHENSSLMVKTHL